MLFITLLLESTKVIFYPGMRHDVGTGIVLKFTKPVPVTVGPYRAETSHE
jgi:hypothetical protein